MKSTYECCTFLIRATLYIGVVVCVFTALPVSAAQMRPQVPAELSVGSTVTIPIILDSQGENINAVEGDLLYPSSLSLVDIRDGNSVITFWVDRPTKQDGAVHFSGITPGGFMGSGEIFTLVFTVVSDKRSAFSLSHARTLLNDGQATDALLTMGAPILQSAESSAPTPSVTITDTTPPDTFKATVSADPYLYEGQYVAIFATQDKGSGIEYYEVAERKGFQTSFFGELTYTRAQSPYVLQDQTLQSYIYVKAVDRSGNERLSVVSPVHLPWYYNIGTLTLIAIVLLIVGFIARNYVRSKKGY